MTLRTIWTAFKRMVLGEGRSLEPSPPLFREDDSLYSGVIVRKVDDFGEVNASMVPVWEAMQRNVARRIKENLDNRAQWLRAEQYESAAKLLEKAQQERAVAVKRKERRSHIDAEIKRLRTLMLKLEMEAKRG